MAELMKGKVWHERKHKMQYPCWAEIKHDEIRCHVIVNPQNYDVVFLSYAGKMLCNMEQFARMWAVLAKRTGIYEFDCGFECNENYNDSYRWVRSSRGIPADLMQVPLKFFLFDLPTQTSVLMSRMNTRAWVADLAKQLNVPVPIVAPQGRECRDEAAVDAAFLASRLAGFEGLMVKDYSALYQRGKRIDGWLKMKPEQDADGVIVEIHEAVSDTDDPAKGLYKGKRLGRAASVTVRLDDGSYATPHGIPHELGRKLWENQGHYLAEVDQWCEFSYMERDRQGGYRHPVFRRLREAKE